MEVELRRDWLSIWRISAGHVLLIRALIFIVFAFVQSMNRLFATVPIMRLSPSIIVVS